MCEDVCHAQFNCPPCKKSRILPCVCGKSAKETACDKDTWSCLKQCGKIFTCNVHYCEEKCHSGECGPCVFALNRTCFCGKLTTPSLNCETNLIQSSCGSTCGKLLKCGNSSHFCLSRCHKGECGSCVVSSQI